MEGRVKIRPSVLGESGDLTVLTLRHIFVLVLTPIVLKCLIYMALEPNRVNVETAMGHRQQVLLLIHSKLGFKSGTRVLIVLNADPREDLKSSSPDLGP